MKCFSHLLSSHTLLHEEHNVGIGCDQFNRNLTVFLVGFIGKRVTLGGAVKAMDTSRAYVSDHLTQLHGINLDDRWDSFNVGSTTVTTISSTVFLEKRVYMDGIRQQSSPNVAKVWH